MSNNDTTTTEAEGAGEGQDGTTTAIDLLQEADDTFQTDSDLGEMVLQGRIGFHSFYDVEESEEYLTTGDTTLLHRAFDEVAEEIHLDEDCVRERYGEVTPETVALEVEMQLDEFVAYRFTGRMADEVQRLLEEREREAADRDGDRDD